MVFASAGTALGTILGVTFVSGFSDLITGLLSGTVDALGFESYDFSG